MEVIENISKYIYYSIGFSNLSIKWINILVNDLLYLLISNLTYTAHVKQDTFKLHIIEVVFNSSGFTFT